MKYFKVLSILLISIILFGSTPCTNDPELNESIKAPIGTQLYPGYEWTRDKDCTDGSCFQTRIVNSTNTGILHWTGNRIPWSMLNDCEDIATCTQHSDYPSYNYLEATWTNLINFSQAIPHYKDGICIALTPLNNERNNIALDWNPESPQALSFINFNDPILYNLYKKWVTHWIDKGFPWCVITGIEASMYADTHNVTDTQALISFLINLKTDIHNTYPQILIGPSTQLEMLRAYRSYPPAKPSIDLWVANMPFMSSDNLIVLSSYPNLINDIQHAGYGVGRVPTPRNHYNLTNDGIIGTQILFAETAQGNGFQKSHLTVISQLASQYIIKGIFWWNLEDFHSVIDPLMGTGQSVNAFYSVGLFNDATFPIYTQNDGYTTWQQMLQLSLAQ